MGDYLTEVTIVTKVTKPTKVVTRVVSFTTDYSGIIPFTVFIIPLIFI